MKPSSQTRSREFIGFAVLALMVAATVWLFQTRYTVFEEGRGRNQSIATLSSTLPKQPTKDDYYRVP